MREKLMEGYLRRKMAFFQAAEDFKKQEKGASDIVAILLVIVVLIAVAAIFREQLMAAVTGVFENLMEALDL
ncbi:MAG: hypothetical protein HFI22_04360 [Lachnospiraceae bacterium]|jgi:Flp pilus assembly pilin Flp|nr:hypothetical protein [Lachnospiraceae bacterium]